MTRKLDLLSQQFGRLTVIASTTAHGGRTYWRCRCACGNEVDVSTGNLRSGNSTSCGCKNLEWLRESKPGRTHGYTDTPTWRVWNSMVQRCADPKQRHYGGRGISVDPRWLKFENFLADMGERPEGLTLDRINSAGNYKPGNCRWADWHTQENNRSINRRITFEDQTLTLAQWARVIGCSPEAIGWRLKAGWSVERALTEPMRPDRRRGNPDRERRLTFDGRSLTIAEWADECGLKYTTLAERLNRGWSVEQALTEPASGRHRKIRA